MLDMNVAEQVVLGLEERVVCVLASKELFLLE